MEEKKSPNPNKSNTRGWNREEKKNNHTKWSKKIAIKKIRIKIKIKNKLKGNYKFLVGEWNWKEK